MTRGSLARGGLRLGRNLLVDSESTQMLFKSQHVEQSLSPVAVQTKGEGGEGKDQSITSRLAAAVLLNTKE